MEGLAEIEVPNSQNLLNDKISQKAISDLIKKVGGFGLYQKISILLFCIGACICGQYTSITPFLFYQDEYKCSSLPSGFTSCFEYVCSLPVANRVNYLPNPSMYTLAHKFGDYRCSDSASTINNSILIMFIGTIISYLFMSILGGYFGRKAFIIVGAFSSIIGTLIAITANSIYFSSFGLLIGSFGGQIMFNIGFTIISEIVIEQKREISLVIFQVFYSLGHLVNTGSYFFIGDWQKIFIICYIVPAIIFIICYFIIAVDTPIALIKNLSPQDALNKFKWIAKINRVEQVQITVEELAKIKQMEQVRQTEENKASQLTVIDLFRYSSLRWMTFALIIVQTSISFLYFAPNLMLNEFQFSIFINGLAFGLASFIATAITFFPIDVFPRKCMAILTLTVTVLCSFILIFIYHTRTQVQGFSMLKNIGILIATFIMIFAITVQYTFFLVYTTQLYPTQVRLIGVSLVNMVSAITLSLSSFIIDAAINSGFKIMIVFLIFAIAGLVFSLFLPETLSKKPNDFIEQLQAKISAKIIPSNRQLPEGSPQSERVLNRAKQIQKK